MPRAVIVTIGPSCQDVDTLCQLLEAGASCARVDLTVRASSLSNPSSSLTHAACAWKTIDHHLEAD